MYFFFYCFMLSKEFTNTTYLTHEFCKIPIK